MLNVERWIPFLQLEVIPSMDHMAKDMIQVGWQSSEHSLKCIWSCALIVLIMFHPLMHHFTCFCFSIFYFFICNCTLRIIIVNQSTILCIISHHRSWFVLHSSIQTNKDQSPPPCVYPGHGHPTSGENGNGKMNWRICLNTFSKFQNSFAFFHLGTHTFGTQILNISRMQIL